MARRKATNTIILGGGKNLEGRENKVPVRKYGESRSQRRNIGGTMVMRPFGISDGTLPHNHRRRRVCLARGFVGKKSGRDALMLP
jgi:hypothetical protein